MTARWLAVIALVLAAPARLLGGAAWETDWDAALDRARIEKKMVLVDFSATWCKPCQYMEKEVLPHPEVERRLAEFVLLRVDFDKSRQARKYGIRSVPTFLFIDPAERVQLRITGGQPVAKFTERLDPIRIVARDALRGSLMIDDPATAAEGHLVVGRTYLRMGETRLAADAFRTAERLAEREGNARVAEMAKIDRMVANDIGGNRKKLLAKLEAPREDESNSGRAYRLLMSGRLLTEMKDSPGAIAAFREAVAAAAGDAELRREAELALATANTTRRKK